MTATASQEQMSPEVMEAAGALAGRILETGLGMLELMTVQLGLETGLYAALARWPLTPPGLAAATGITPRYCREWLEQQTMAGFVEVEEPSDDADARVFRLPASTAAVLAAPGTATACGRRRVRSTGSTTSTVSSRSGSPPCPGWGSSCPGSSTLGSARAGRDCASPCLPPRGRGGRGVDPRLLRRTRRGSTGPIPWPASRAGRADRSVSRVRRLLFEEYRRVLLKRFPYMAVYVVDDDRIDVLAIRQCSP